MCVCVCVLECMYGCMHVCVSVHDRCDKYRVSRESQLSPTKLMNALQKTKLMNACAFARVRRYMFVRRMQSNAACKVEHHQDAFVNGCMYACITQNMVAHSRKTV